MAKKALCIGINDYPGTGNDLSGCVNDANDWRAALEKHDFVAQQLLNGQATKDAMCQGIQRLVLEAQPGDVIAITYSGHGSWVPDADKDEADAHDEVLCPYDISHNRPLTDDELYNIFSKRERDVRIVFISDSCHSGTVSRFPKASAKAAGSRIRFLPPAYFLPSDKLQMAEKRVLRRGAGIRPFGGVLLSGCQDTEYSYDALFNDRPNGAFTYFALKALKAIRPSATYEEWYKAIRASLPNPLHPQTPNLQGTRAQKTWVVFEVEKSIKHKGEKPMRHTANPSAEHSRSAWVLDQPGQHRSTNSSRPTSEMSSIRDGDYVTAMESAAILYRIQNGCRRLISTNDIETMSITQNDIKQVDSLELLPFPLESTQQRAVGRNLQRYLQSDLRSGHWMYSWVWLQGTTLTVRTKTETVTWFGGYTGGVSVLLFDSGGNRIKHDEIRYRYGVDGRAFGSGWREDTETIQLPQSVADAAESILILHYWDPKVDLVRGIVQAVKVISQVLALIFMYRNQGQPMNGGGEEF